MENNLQFIWELLLLNTGEDNDVYKDLRLDTRGSKDNTGSSVHQGTGI